jgi:hypothetical protein
MRGRAPGVERQGLEPGLWVDVCWCWQVGRELGEVVVAGALGSCGAIVTVAGVVVIVFAFRLEQRPGYVSGVVGGSHVRCEWVQTGGVAGLRKRTHQTSLLAWPSLRAARGWSGSGGGWCSPSKAGGSAQGGAAPVQAAAVAATTGAGEGNETARTARAARELLCKLELPLGLLRRAEGWRARRRSGAICAFGPQGGAGRLLVLGPNAH